MLKKLFQKDNHTFIIEWSDGNIDEYRLNKLQAHCPCAKCQLGSSSSDEDVRAIDLVSMGRYALKIQFTSGCSSGIYSFEYLKQIALKFKSLS